eukprot:gene175-2363_t
MQTPLTANLVEEVLVAYERVKPHVHMTPVVPSLSLADEFRCTVHLKCENFQHAGSFKLRGAMNKLLSMTPDQRASGVATASTGNHGMAVALGARLLGCKATIFHPAGSEEGKLRGIRQLGASLEEHGTDVVECEMAAAAWADESGSCYVSPYNDIVVAAGQGTISCELQRQLDGVDAIFVSVGGGGLIAGVGAHLKNWQPQAKVYGCSPTNSAVLLQSIEAGQLLDLPSLPTLSDGTAGGVEAGAVTFPLCQQVVDQPVYVSEEEISQALLFMLSEHHMLVEGSAAVAVAAFKQVAKSGGLVGKRAVILLCGANIGVPTLKTLLE